MFEIFHFVFDASVALYVYIMRRNSVTMERVNNLEKNAGDRFESNTDRLARLETTIQHAVKPDDLAEIYAEMRHLSHDVATMAGEIGAIKNTMTMINQHLIDRG